MRRQTGSSWRGWTAYGAIPVLYGLTLLFVLGLPTGGGEYGGPLLAGLSLAFSAAALWLGRHCAQQTLDMATRSAGAWGAAALVSAALFAVLACAAVARFVVETSTISGDELAYIFQARTYAEGRLWAHTPPVVDAVGIFHVFDLHGKWVSQYLPGWPLVMAAAAALQIPLWLVNPILAAATLATFFALARCYVGRETAWIGLVLLAGSAFFLMTYGSYFNHGFATLCGSAFALFGSRYGRDGRARDALLAGVFIGAMGLTRPQNAAVFAAPFVVFLALARDRRQGLGWFLLGGAPFLATLLAYDAAMTGDPLKPVQAKMVHEPLGVPGWTGLKREIQRLLRLPEWTSPVLLFGWAAAFVLRLRRRSLDFTDWIMPVTFVALLFYGGQGGPQYGSRYFFEAWPFAILTVLKAIDPLLTDTAKSGRAAWIASGLLAAATVQLAYIPPRLWHEHRIVEQVGAPYRAVRAANLKHALVLFREGDDRNKFRNVWARDFVHNGPDIERQDVIYALDRGPRNDELLAAYPGRAAYVWANGALRPLANAPANPSRIGAEAKDRTVRLATAHTETGRTRGLPGTISLTH